MTSVHQSNPRLTALGISAQDCLDCNLPVQIEAQNLVASEDDIFGRSQLMTRTTLNWWNQMKQAALDDDIELTLVSAYRSFDYQCNLIQKKLDKGQTINEIIKVNAIPGYSEHHTGCALDLSTRDCAPLEEEFDRTLAFRWLTDKAHNFHFYMTYPKSNEFKIAYEPWHWRCRLDAEN